MGVGISWIGLNRGSILAVAIDLKVAFHSRKFLFKVFSNVHLNDHNV